VHTERPAHELVPRHDATMQAMTAHRPDPTTVPTLDQARTPGHLIRRAQRVHGALWAGSVGAEPTGPQFAVLSSIARRPGLDQTTAGVLASLDKATTVGIVRRLVQHGWITVDPDPNDRRRKVLHLSRPARAALYSLTKSATTVQQALLAPLTPEQRRDFVPDLATLAYEGDPPTPVQDENDVVGLELSTTPGHLIRRAQQHHTAKWTARFQGSLTGPQYATLCVLAENEPIDQATLGELASLDKSSIAQVVDRLAARGLIIALTDATDRRRKTLRLSDAAKAALPKMTSAAAAVQAELMALLPTPRHEPFLDALAAVAHQDVPGISAVRL
jgi:DNA-binding MarR family transcriptional regulator